jgi:hypothetical protein
MPGTSGYQQNERSVGLNGLWASSEPDQSSNRGRMVECLERAATKARQSCDNLYIHIPDCLLQLSVQSRFGFDFRTIISDLSKIQVPSDTSICWPCQVKPVEPQTILHLTQVAPQVAPRPWRLPVACAGVHSPTMAGQASPIVTCTNSYSASNDNSNLDAI